MNSTKEYLEILTNLKMLINNLDFASTDEKFTKDFLKSLLTSNSIFESPLNFLKEKYKSQNEKNKNIFYIIKNSHKKYQKENKAVLFNLKHFSLFYNEPKYIEELNTRIYKRVTESLIEMSREVKWLSLINGKNNNETDSDALESISSKMKFNINFLDEIYNAKNENLVSDSGSGKFNFRLKHLDHNLIKQTFEEIVLSMYEADEEKINNKKRRELIDTLIKENKKNKLIEVLKLGIPHSMRRKIYIFLMGGDIDLMESSRRIDDNVLLIDYLIIEDVKNAVANENYFLFEENLKNALFQLVRDKEVLTEIQGVRPILLISLPNTQDSTPYPPSGIIPFSGFAFQCACFCYLSTNLSELFQITKTFYCRYLSFLSSFTSNKNSIVGLIYNFQQIFSSNSLTRDIFLHFNTIRYDINQLVFSWMTTSYGGLFSPENIFFIYDIVLLTDSLSVMIIVALSVLYYKKSVLLTLQTKEEVLHQLDSVKYENKNVLELLNKFLNDY